jgi:sugar lactone lactonase YvrE
MELKITDMYNIAIFVIPMALLSVVIGLMWNRREWLINAAIFWGVFTVLYTSMFTNGAGFFTGLFGSLGYWLEQQGVQRGSQPWYYYALVQVPVYEYLPALGTWLAFIFAGWAWLVSKANKPVEVTVEENFAEGLQVEQTADLPDEPSEEFEDVAPVFPLLGFWAITSMVAYSIAGEKMPWLTVHITLPAILCAAWAIGRLIDSIDWQVFKERRRWLVLVLLPVFLLGVLAALGSLLGGEPPFQGKELTDLQATSTFLTSLLVAVASGIGLFYLIKDWSAGQFSRLVLLYLLTFLAFLTARSAFLASYIIYDYANELLVYAHSAPGVKTALDQIEEISRRTTDGLGVVVAYDNATSYPYWWYLRNYPNARYYGADPTRSLRDVPLILVGDENFGKIEPIVANLYDRFDYIRLWWPNQDYFGLTWPRIQEALTNPEMRSALFQIWLNRDYTKYGQVLNKDMSLPNWSPAARMRLYVRKDLISQLWNYGAPPAPEAVQADPFEGKHIVLSADTVIGAPGTQPGQFQRPRDLAVAPDGSLYVVDTDNHRIQHLAPDGTVLQVWGSFGDATAGQAPGGTFNQPWGIGLAPDGSVYVADTWNHRIQKFTAEGEFVTMWGSFGQGERPDAFWGPRDVAVDANGNVFITDTGNKRVVIFDGQGQSINQFGSAGMSPGQLDEPVGIVIDKDSLVYVADTWNQRVQVFSQNEDGSYSPFRSWDVQAWYGQSLDNKPYLAVDDQVSVFIADPEGYRILQFTAEGESVRSWGDFGAGLETFGMPASVAWDLNGGVWVTDAANGRIMHFTLPVP